MTGTFPVPLPHVPEKWTPAQESEARSDFIQSGRALVAPIRRLLAIVALGVALAGCAKCQDWRIFGAGDASLDACKSDTLPPH